MMVIIPVLEGLDEPISLNCMAWREFKAVEQLLDTPGVWLSSLE
ncbi:hypothetical protein PN499_11465 [Kamptonema animale CS-326]|nr:hypothetical protein [Kamptonema animale]MDB9511804.1 hypothetical protein [Kamptonema animale CS-326]